MASTSGVSDEKTNTNDQTECRQEEFYNFLDERHNKTFSLEDIASIKDYCSKLEESKSNYESLSNRLSNDLNRQNLKCETLEMSRSSLRSTIKKASANWIERKAQLSENESEPCPDDVQSSDKLFNSDDKCNNSELDIYIELKYKNEQLELYERRTEDLNKRLKDYEKVIDDQEIIVHGLKEQLDTYFTDNLKMSKQLAELTKLFQEIEATNYQQVNMPEVQVEASGTSNPPETAPSPQEDPTLSKSVSKTYIKLKELIYEKKSLVTEIERLKVLNLELQLRVSQQENRLVSVSDALQDTWLIVSNLKDEHAKIHTEESIMRYELKEKREILRSLREELDWARDQWHIIRKMNSDSETEWKNLRQELDDRKSTEESEIVKNKSIETQSSVDRDHCFEPPIDLLLDMGIEYGVIDADDDEPLTGIALLHGEDVHNERLRDLEEQCGYLYQKLMTSTTRALALASRLTSLHEHYSMSDDEEEEGDEEEEDLFEDNNNDVLYESSIISQDSESNDTAYVSEVDGLESGGEPSVSTNDTEESLPQDSATSYGSSPEEVCDVLSKRLINFLPKKIEILSNENKNLEARVQYLQEERVKSETAMKSTLDFEIRQRRKLEEQLSHLGKCVDELKLERNGEIKKAEEELQRKIEEINEEHKEHQQVIDELEMLKEKFNDRGEILQLTAIQLEETEIKATTAEEIQQKLKNEIDTLLKEMIELKESRPEKSPLENKVPAHSNSKTCCNGKADISFAKDDECVADVATRGVEQFAFSRSINSCPDESQEGSYTCIPQVVLNKDATFRLPFYLVPDTVLQWIISVASQEIVFGITYANETANGNVAEISRRNESSSLPVDASTSVDLISPVVIRSADSPSKGRLVAKIAGHYCLNFNNVIDSTQLINYQIWIHNAKDK